MGDFNKLISNLEAKKKKLEALRDKVLPVKVGNVAVNHFKQNFREGGFRDGGLQKWKTTRRQESGDKSASSQYGPLLSRQNHLMQSIHYVPEAGKVTVINDVDYAQAHNTGMNVMHRVTPKMRRFAWARFFAASGIKKTDSKEVKKNKEAAMNDKDKFWKGLALTRRKSIIQHIPQRKFMGHGKELNGIVRDIIDREVSNALKD